MDCDNVNYVIKIVLDKTAGQSLQQRRAKANDSLS